MTLLFYDVEFIPIWYLLDGSQCDTFATCILTLTPSLRVRIAIQFRISLLLPSVDTIWSYLAAIRAIKNDTWVMVYP